MSRPVKLTRVEISYVSPELDGISHMNIYVDWRTGVKVGNQINLVDSDSPDDLWVITAVHETISPTEIKHGWNNNI